MPGSQPLPPTHCWALLVGMQTNAAPLGNGVTGSYTATPVVTVCIGQDSPEKQNQQDIQKEICYKRSSHGTWEAEKPRDRPSLRWTSGRAAGVALVRAQWLESQQGQGSKSWPESGGQRAGRSMSKGRRRGVSQLKEEANAPSLSFFFCSGS